MKAFARVAEAFAHPERAMIETQKAFSALSEEYVERSLAFDPVAATLAGIHDYDTRFPDDTPDGFRERSAWLRDLDQRLVSAVPWQELSTEARVDYALLRSRIATQRMELDDLGSPSRDPVRYPENALRGLFLLLARPFAPLEERKESVLARLMAVPDYLDRARANLTRVPELFHELAIEVTAGGLTYVDELVRTLLRSFPGEAERVEHAGSTARLGFLRYQEWLEQELSKRLGGTFAIGERWMNYKLEREHMLPMDCAYLAVFGREQMAHARALLQEEARRIDPSRSWQALLEDAQRRHPEPLRVREAYVAELERARRFVEDRRLAPVHPCRLEILDTPVYERAFTAYAAYLGPAPFDIEQTAYFFVTPVDLSRRREEVEARIRGHSFASITLIALHEAYPGHHLQLSHAAHSGSRLRRLFDDPVMSEGWAFYCERLMDEQGFFTDPLTRIVRLRDELWRACRVVVDVELHSGRMTFGEAVELLEREVVLDRASAEMEVKRYAMMPTDPLSFYVGRQLLLELREEAQRALGARFSLYDFHEAVLRSGTIPPSLVREELHERLGLQH